MIRQYFRLPVSAIVLIAGISAGAIATVAQLVLWLLAEMPLPETLFQDARLTAALVMVTGVLPPPSTSQWDILLVAMLIYFSLSVAYALIPALLASHLRTGPAFICRRPVRPGHLRYQPVRIHDASPLVRGCSRMGDRGFPPRIFSNTGRSVPDVYSENIIPLMSYAAALQGVPAVRNCALAHRRFRDC